MDYKISLIDNDSIFLDFLKTVLTSNGYSVKTSPHCSHAVDLFEHWKPNLIILDSNVDDIKTLHFIQEIQASSLIPIIFIANLDNHLSALECLNNSAAAYLYKPVSISELLAKVNFFEHAFVWPANLNQGFSEIQTQSVREQ